MRIHAHPEIRGSHLFALVPNFQLELPALKAHQHPPELIPGDFPAIDNNQRHTTILSFIPLDPSSHYFIGNGCAT